VLFSLQEAYELIIGKRQGKEVEGRPTDKSGWDFHDWYWRFSMRRRRGKGAATPTEEAPPLSALRQQWQAQVAGLRHKAAAKRSRQQVRRQTAAQAPAGGPAGSAAAREGVWRSTTKNARKASSTVQQQRQRLAAEQQPASAAVLQQQHVAPQAPQESAGNAARRAGSKAPRSADHFASAEAADANMERQPAKRSAARHASHAASHLAQVEHLRQLFEHAASLGQPDREDAPSDHVPHAPPTPAEPQGSGGWRDGMFSGDRFARVRVSLEQLVTLVRGQAGAATASLADGASSAVPATEQLRHHLAASMRASTLVQSEQALRSVGSPDEATMHAGQQGEQQQQQHHHHQHSAHAHKFADRQAVEGRLTSQLAGLKRRAALKQEVESHC
jgi:hypothetical protein